MHVNITLRQLLESDAQIRRLVRAINSGLPSRMDQEELANLVSKATRAGQLVVLNYSSGDPDAVRSFREGSPYRAGTPIPPEASQHLYFFHLARASNPTGAYMHQSVDQMMDLKWGRPRRVVSVELMPDPR